MKLSELEKRVNTISAGPRLGHFIIDLFVIQVISYLINIIPAFEISGFLEILLFPLYYVVFEYFYQWTPGKYITGTIVIDDYGNKPDIQSIILRTFIRLAPFEPFSCLDDKSFGWHDRWTKTYVIKKDNLPKIQAELGHTEGSTGTSVPLSNKVNKNILIVAILCIAGVSGYHFVKQVQEVFSFNFDETISNLNEADKILIKGKWNSNWQIYKSLNFINDKIVIATNQNNNKLELNYTVDTKTLIIKDDLGLELSYFILELSERKMVFRDLNAMKENIEFEKE